MTYRRCMHAASTQAHRGRAGVRGVRGLLVQGTKIVRRCAAMAVVEACSRHGEHEVATCGVVQPGNTSFRANPMAAELPAWASMFCIKLVQDAVAVQTSAFYESSFPAKVLRRPTFMAKCGMLPPGTCKPTTRNDDLCSFRQGQGLPDSWRH